MTAGQRLITQGTTLAYDLTGGTTFVSVFNLLDITQLPDIEAVDHDMTGIGDSVDDFAKGLIKIGTVVFKVAYSTADSTHKALANLAFASNTAVIPNWEITFPKASSGGSSETFTFTAWVKGFKAKPQGKGGMLESEITLRVRNAATGGYTTS